MATIYELTSDYESKLSQLGETPIRKTVLGVGYNSGGKHMVIVNGKKSLPYRTWYNMLTRCYGRKSHSQSPTYTGCYVSNDWLDYQCFADWYVNQNHYSASYELDKDLLVSGNKVYSPNTCCLIPSELNLLMTDRANHRGAYPVGVMFHRGSGRFIARISNNGKRIHLGMFDDPTDAYDSYVSAKEKYVKGKAAEWSDRIDDRVFQALMNWRVGR